MQPQGIGFPAFEVDLRIWGSLTPDIWRADYQEVP
jgi:hypothetical protein